MNRARISFWTDEKSTDQFSVRWEEHGSVFGAMRRARISFWTDEKSTDQFFGPMRRARISFLD